jgi:hypothetical protein
VKNSQPLLGGLGALLAGLGLGWLVALSRSAILATVVPALFTALVGSLPLVEAARKTPEAERTSGAGILVLGLMIAGAAVGSSLGARAVAQAWFAPRPDAYQALADKIADDDAKKKYIDQMFGSLATEKAIAPPLQAGEVTRLPSPQCMHVQERALAASGELDADDLADIRAAAKGDAALERIVRAAPSPGLKQRILDWCHR